MQMIGEVNRKHPDDQQYSYMFFYPGKMQKIMADYRQLYPHGRLNLWGRALQIAGFLCIGLAAIAAGFFR